MFGELTFDEGDELVGGQSIQFHAPSEQKFSLLASGTIQMQVLHLRGIVASIEGRLGAALEAKLAHVG